MAPIRSHKPIHKWHQNGATYIEKLPVGRYRCQKQHPNLLLFSIRLLSAGVAAKSGICPLGNKRSGANGANMLRIMLALLFFIPLLFCLIPAIRQMAVFTKTVHRVKLFSALRTYLFPDISASSAINQVLPFFLIAGFMLRPTAFTRGVCHILRFH